MKNTVLTEIVNKVKELKGILAIPLDNWDRRTSPGMKIKQRMAENTIVDILVDYRKALHTNALGIIVVGNQASQFSKIAAQDAGCYVVEANALYVKLAKELKDLSSNFSVDHVIRLTEDIRDISKLLAENGLLRMDSIPYPGGVNIGATIKGFDSLVTLIRASVEAGFTEPGERPNDLARAFLVDSVLESATNDFYDREFLPIVITGATGEQLSDLRNTIFDGRIFVVQAGETDISAAFDISLTGKVGKKKVVDALLKAKAKMPKAAVETVTEAPTIEEATATEAPVIEEATVSTTLEVDTAGDVDET